MSILTFIDHVAQKCTTISRTTCSRIRGPTSINRESLEMAQLLFLRISGGFKITTISRISYYVGRMALPNYDESLEPMATLIPTQNLTRNRMVVHISSLGGFIVDFWGH